MYGVFRDKCKVRPAEILYTLIATAASNLVFSWVFGSANSVTQPDRRNAKMVYSCASGHCTGTAFQDSDRRANWTAVLQTNQKFHHDHKLLNEPNFFIFSIYKL